ncbi:putative L-gulonolactone oxidase [Trypanosoma conorhini]|uniref:Putative L-gulonolactone oxidase n=1 Tax=Trypanosoma conorhini TaxID=83891 RepID=A0A422PRC5_9TRYP|nr:putative L-gulonolactone oxidase [Trypanosoma conorhini]RNF20057.1 putative L-gulonolactone oxidase [Trypanosoma conorhini]
MRGEAGALPAWTNMACIGQCYPHQHHFPGSVEEVVALMRRLRQTGERCRVARCAKSPNSCTFTDAHLIHTDRLNRILSVDVERQRIVCEGGALLRDVFEKLSEHDLMLRCVPSYVLTTVAGAIATATHGSGSKTRSLSDYVVSIVLVDGSGELHTFDASTPKELSLAACHLGMLGVVVQVTLQAERKRMWRLRSSPVPLHTLTEGATLERRVSDSAFYRFFWMPNTDSCYESIGTCVEAAATGPAKEAVLCATTTPASASRRLTQLLKAAQHPRGAPLNYQDWLELQKHPRTRLCKALKGNWLRHGVVEAALAAATAFPRIQPYINRAYNKVYYSAPEVLYGTPLECFTFDCLFKQWACEWAIDASKAIEAFRVLRELIASEHLSVHFPVEFRFTDADKTALSPAFGRKTCWIGIVMYRPYLRYARDTMRYYQAFSDAMTALGGRPHWAKYYTWGPSQLKEAYGQNWEDFLRLRQKLDPGDLFVNGWWKSLSGQGPVFNSTISRL